MSRSWTAKWLHRLETVAFRAGLLDEEYIFRRYISESMAQELAYSEVRAHWEKESSKVHGSVEPEFMKAIAEQVAKGLDLESSDRLLSIGCGDGKVDSYLKDKVEGMCGYDFSGQKIEAAKELNPTVTYWRQSFLEKFASPPPVGINKIYSFGVVQYCRAEDLHWFLELQVNFLRKHGGGVIGHFDVPDVDKAYLYIQKFSKETIRKYRHSFRVMPPDGSHWHDMENFRTIAKRLGVDIHIKDATTYYRSDILIYVH